MIFLWRCCMIFLWGCVIFWVVWLLDFFLCWEVAWVFVRRGCVMFLDEEVAFFFTLTHSWGCVTFFVLRGCMIFFRLHDFCFKEVVWFFGGCEIFFYEEVAWFFCMSRGCVLLKGCMIFVCGEFAWFFHPLTSVLQGDILGFNVIGCEGRKEIDRFQARKKHVNYDNFKITTERCK